MSQTSRPVPGQRYRHFKGNLYQILTLAYDSETNEEMVISGIIWRFYSICPLAGDVFGAGRPGEVSERRTAVPV